MVGKILSERYEIVRTLGFGGMGRVFLAHHLGLGDKQVAIKQVDIHLDPEGLAIALAEFQREATMLAHLEHPGLAKALDFFEEDEQCFLVMEYVPGETLWELIQKGRPSLLQVLDWGAQLCDVLAYLHRQQPPILHRDLKPGNIILQSDGRLKLVDFGLARFDVPGGRTVTVFAGAGTPGFAPVEQYTGGTDTRSDLYSLGATLYHMVTGEIPNNSVALMSGEEILPPPRHYNPHLPMGVQSCILKLMALRREDRYATAQEAAQALARAALPVRLSDREFKICGLCRHLSTLETEPDHFAYACQKLGWQTQPSHSSRGLSRELPEMPECPHWEAAG